MKRVLLAALCGLVVACAVNAETASQSPLKVDLDQVVASRNVSPVEGITSAGQPDAAAFKVFADSGYVAVIEMRTSTEDRGLDEQAVVEALGMKYISMPIGRDDITFEKAAALDELLATIDEPVLVHCASANRVGALLALRASAGGADDEAALATGKEGGMTRLEPLVREALSRDKK